MASKIDMISSALVLIGDLPINTLAGNSRAQQVAANTYDSIVNYEISRHRWGFARTKDQLSLTTDTPIDSDYSSIYQLPSDLIVLIKITPRVEYQIYGDKLYCNLSQALYCDYTYKPTENEFPAYFVKMMEYALAKDFSTSIRDSSASRGEMTREYLNASANAMALDSQQHPQTPIVHSPFTDVRF